MATAEDTMTALPTEPTPTFPFRVLRKVGEGAMGCVYRAEDLELGRTIAIKVVRPAFLSMLPEDQRREASQRFVQEARAAAALSHPGVPTVHRIGTEHGVPYIAMEWIEGRALDAILASRRRLPLEQAVQIAMQVLDVLAVAHDAGIVHRDIKPANLMITREGRVKVTDFGIARVQGSNLAQTQAGMVLGTPHYAAPEQMSGRAIDCRADLYALGSVLYELLVGRPPFDGASIFEVIRQVVLEEAVAPSVIVPELPPALDAVVMRALSKSPDDRFGDARTMAHALQPFVSGAPRDAGPGDDATMMSGSAPTMMASPMLVVGASSSHGIVAAVARSWPSTSLGRLSTERLLGRILERPLHAAAFSGAVEAGTALLLVSDGVIYAALDPEGGDSGDGVIEALPEVVEATLFAAPLGLDPRIVSLLASLLVPASPRLSGLDTSFADLPQLAGKLAAEGFDGAIRFCNGARLGFALFGRGKRLLDVFGGGWSDASAGAPWEHWIGASGAMASVEDRQVRFPSLTFRQQLAGVALCVVRAPEQPDAVRTDTVAALQALELRPREPAPSELRRGESTFLALLDGDPAYALARWALVDLAPQFQQYGRTARWKALVEPLSAVREVRLHHAVPRAGGGTESFDVVVCGEGGRHSHVLTKVAHGTAEAVERFVARAIAAKEARDGANGLAGAILVAPRFDDAALEAYLRALRPRDRPSIFRALDAFSHREGYLRLGSRSGLHILLVEDEGGRRRPLVPG